MQYLFNTVLTTSIYAAIVGLIIVFVKGLLKNRLSARWHYLIWIVLIMKLLLPFGPESTISFFNVVPDVEYYSVRTIAEEPEYINEAHGSTEAPSETEKFTVSEINHIATFDIKALLPYIWAAGAAIMLIWLIASFWIFYKKLQKGIYPLEDRVLRIQQNCMNKMGVKRYIPIIIQNAVSMPSLFGVFHPKILLPQSAVKFTDKELEHILMHELAHYKRKDILINYLLLALQTVHWFNPVMWYCFNKMREDMELAADEQVLSLLTGEEHKAYGRTLIAILEGFSGPRLAPRLLAMADDKKSIEKRLNMIKMTEFFKRRRRLVILAGLLCIALLSGILLTNAVTDKDSISSSMDTYDAEKLLKYRTEYVGDNAAVTGIMNNLSYGGYIEEITLQTNTEPYEVTVKYDFKNNEPSQQEFFDKFHNNAAIAFALIKNVGTISFDTSTSEGIIRFTRDKFIYDNVDLWSFSENEKNFKKLLQDLLFGVHVTPVKYELTMSSTPGIRIMELYQGESAVKAVRYSAETGSLATWEPPAGKVVQEGKTVEMPRGKAVYWSPLSNSGTKEQAAENIVKITLLDKAGKEIGSREIKIVKNGYGYEVQREPGIYTDSNSQVQETITIEEAVRSAILDKASDYRNGEAVTEGHVILSEHEMGPMIKVYAIVSIGNFGFENGVFTKISGSGAIPTVITLDNREESRFALLEYKEPQDGSYYAKSIKEMFPIELQKEALDAQKHYKELIKQQELQAGEYLKSIGRAAKVSADYVEKELIDINVDASNKLFAEMSKYDSFINTCPYWIGTIEQIEDGIRYIYQTSHDKTSDGYDIVTFTKSKEDGTVEKQVKYKIVGSEVQQIE